MLTELLALCEGNPPVTHHKGPVMRGIGFFVVFISLFMVTTELSVLCDTMTLMHVTQLLFINID